MCNQIGFKKAGFFIFPVSKRSYWNLMFKKFSWFEDITENRGVQMLTDINGCLLISGYNYDYPA
jgi:hypothetical protein